MKKKKKLSKLRQGILRSALLSKVGSKKLKLLLQQTDEPFRVLKAKEEIDRKRNIKTENKTRQLENRLRLLNEQMHCYNEIA